MNHALAENFVAESTDKQAISEAFGRAAQTYDQHAAFQRDVGHRLLEWLPWDLSGCKILDLGCGTGYFSQQLLARGAQVVCCDLSTAMLQQAESRCGTENITYQQGDAECLPFYDHQFDYVFSSLALQWCANLAVPLAEMRRVTRKGGQAIFSTLLEGSLSELKQAWAKVDSYQHVNDFITANQVKIALAQADCKNHHLDLPTITVWYSSAFALMRDLKGIGANHVQGRSSGMTRRQSLKHLEQEYQNFQHNHQGLVPATYQVCLGKINL
ncbi:malonyl-ACP O-methyltransferase BioC [Vibrio panuliri]|uniref:Malonyl-[acyl-carrier protein] O-methyltransferase n=1 Tax=Vibrio panuliri TaxID=1381081 RepID=A0ABX3FQK9_9VIBR|nr:malonyl-ACP O-methyltransferase BioC [Vibrio panuliri]KAB1454760.1 malonyl-ACP O-methyltransferase BioC [Vibrio panuliri]OLQ96529.1 malonyl-[acyl-carrier protein] O-methyltransferase BioC [Vibrio panuliri]